MNYNEYDEARELTTSEKQDIQVRYDIDHMLQQMARIARDKPMYDEISSVTIRKSRQGVRLTVRSTTIRHL